MLIIIFNNWIQQILNQKQPISIKIQLYLDSAILKYVLLSFESKQIQPNSKFLGSATLISKIN